MTTDFDQADFARVVGTLAPYLDDIVFVGGWAQRLFRLHPLASGTQLKPLMTLDADIAAPVRLSRRGRSLRELLLDARFVEVLSGTESPPKTKYQLNDTSGVYVEFITPLTGGACRRDGTSDATAKIQGVTAEKLRHVGLLLASPWTLELTEDRGFPVGVRPVSVKVCNPVSYLAQKVLVLPSRRRLEQGKDVLYIHDTLLLFGAAFEELRSLWVAEIRGTLEKRACAEVVQAGQALFGEITDRSREAANVARGANRRIQPSALAAVCRLGLSEIFVA